MGGTSYARPVYGSSTKSTNRQTGSMSSNAASAALTEDNLHADMNPTGKFVKCATKSPLFIFLDVTGSNIDFARVTYDKAPMFYGQIEQQNYLEEFMLALCGVGDANCDYAPLQIAELAKGLDVDAWLKKLYLESGGGGQRMETYELAAYFALTHLEFDATVELPFCFFVGDEAPYPTLDQAHIVEYIGDKDVSTLDTQYIFSQLYDKFKGNLFMILNKYCGGGKPDIDEWIYEEWCKVIPRENVIRVTEEKSVIDLIRGIIAMVSKSRTLEEYQHDLATLTDPSTGALEPQSPERIANVGTDLAGYSKALTVIPDVSGDLPTASIKKKGGASRL